MTDWTIAEASRRIAARALSPVELTTELLGKIETFEPQLNAFIRQTPELAMQQAKAAEAEIAASGPRGPLHGIPFGLKDIFGTKGIPTTGHSRSAIDHVPAEDAVTVAKLYEAGGVLMGKLATHEFAHGGPSFDLPWPPARNPWNTAHITGGSSSGSGAAVAAGLVLGAMGSDTGGSIRNPAALCGISGLKPTYGLLSRRGVWTNSFSYDHAGPMAWTAEDCSLLLDALAGHDPGDPASANRPKESYHAALTGDIRGMRIGVLRELYETDVPVPAVAKAAMDAALEVLKGLGAVLEDVRIRPAADYYAVKVLTAESELYAVHEKGLRENAEKFGEDFLGRSLAAILIRAEDYMQAQRERRVMLAEFEPLYAKYDALVTAAPGPAARFEAWRTIHFWQKGSLTTPFNVSGGPAMSQCIGFTPEGLPLSMQVVGRPFDDATVLRLANAYERATPWRDRRPALVAGASAPPLPPVPDPTPADVTPAERDAIALIARRAGLTLNPRQFELLCAAAPYVEQMAGRLRRERRFTEEPASVFTFGA